MRFHTFAKIVYDLPKVIDPVCDPLHVIAEGRPKWVIFSIPHRPAECWNVSEAKKSKLQAPFGSERPYVGLCFGP